MVLELGCLPWTGPEQRACGTKYAGEYPAASISAVGDYLHAGLIDVFDLSSGLQDPSVYQHWGTTLDQAQTQAWQHAQSLGWADLTDLHARKALAAPGGYQGSAAQAAADVHTYVGLPLAEGARAVDVWTWRQPYSGSVVSLLPNDMRTTPFWQALEAQRRAGADLFTNMTPSAMPADPKAFAHECDVIAQMFSAVLVAAGTG